MGRRASREITMKLLYQLEIQKDDKEEQIEYIIAENNLTQKDKDYILNVIEGVSSNVEQIDFMIDNHSKGWRVNRLSKVDLSILRLSVFEMVYRKDIPHSVSANEAVELAKRYSSEESGAFVHGVLGKISNSLNKISQKAE